MPRSPWRRRAALCIAGALAAATSAAAIEEPPKASALSPVVGWIDGVSLNGNVMTLSGWALTSDYPGAAIGIRVLIDGQLAIPNFRVANEYRPDVGAAYPGYGNYHGFLFTVPAPHGNHTVTAQGQNSGVYNLLSGSIGYSLPDQGNLRRYWGGSFPADPGANLAWTYFRSGTTYDWQIDYAMAAWDATATNLQITRTLSTDTTNRYRFYTEYNAASWWAYTDSRLCPGTGGAANVVLGCTYAYSNITLNTRTLAGETDDQKRAVVAHEAGHAMGLWHPPAGAATSIMNGGYISATRPRDPAAYDVTGVNTLYPRNYGDTP